MSGAATWANCFCRHHQFQRKVRLSASENRGPDVSGNLFKFALTKTDSAKSGNSMFKRKVPKLKAGGFTYASPDTVPVTSPNLSVSIPIFCNMETNSLQSGALFFRSPFGATTRCWPCLNPPPASRIGKF
jgi:hypothetical protein